MMNDTDREALDAITTLYSAPSRLRPGAFVRHDIFTGKPYVDLPPLMQAGIQMQGYDAADCIRRYEAMLQACGEWPEPRPDLVLLPRFKRWKRRGWRVVIGRRR